MLNIKKNNENKDIYINDDNNILKTIIFTI